MGMLLHRKKQEQTQEVTKLHNVSPTATNRFGSGKTETVVKETYPEVNGVNVPVPQRQTPVRRGRPSRKV